MKLYHELAEYYFSIESSHRNIKNDISLIRSLIRDRKSPSILDLGCGTGEHLNLLSRYGIKCIGIDNSEDMLKIARKRFRGNIEFIKMDITEFDYYDEFDVIISLFGSINYLIEDSKFHKALWNTWKALKPDGIGLFEIWNSIPIQNIKEKNISPISTTKYNDTFIERERGYHLISNIGKTIAEVNYRYNISNHENSATLTDKHVMRSFTIEEIKKFFLDNGLNIREIYANSDKEPFQDNSNKILVLFDKQ